MAEPKIVRVKNGFIFGKTYDVPLTEDLTRALNTMADIAVDQHNLGTSLFQEGRFDPNHSATKLTRRGDDYFARQLEKIKAAEAGIRAELRKQGLPDNETFADLVWRHVESDFFHARGVSRDDGRGR